MTININLRWVGMKLLDLIFTVAGLLLLEYGFDRETATFRILCTVGGLILIIWSDRFFSRRSL